MDKINFGRFPRFRVDRVVRGDGMVGALVVLFLLLLLLGVFIFLATKK
jgi:hypothetical protein